MSASVVSLSEMVNSSIDVLRRPSVLTFERYEKRGNLQTGLLYVGIGALIAGLLGASGGWRGMLQGALTAIISFLIFTATAYYVGRSQGGTGSLDEVAYSFALFIVPLQVLSSAVILVLAITIIGLCLVPFVGIAVIVAYAFYAWLAVQSSMNLFDSTKTLITLGAAVLATIVGSIVVGSLI